MWEDGPEYYAKPQFLAYELDLPYSLVYPNGGKPGSDGTVPFGQRTTVEQQVRACAPCMYARASSHRGGHVHGVYDAPAHDDAFAAVGPGEARAWTYAIAPGSGSGLLWYHPHLHRASAGQVCGGMAGDGGGKVVRTGRVVRQPGDGNCLFHSMSYGLRDGSTARSLRAEIMSFIRANPTLEISETPLRVAVSDNLGFGGHNAALVFKAYEA